MVKSVGMLLLTQQQEAVALYPHVAAHVLFNAGKGWAVIATLLAV
jgi:hypothetical protein